jgi:hypothetical protein
MEVERGLVYPRQTMLDDDLVNTSSYVVVKVDMVHENSKDLKLEVSSDDTTLTSIDVDPSAAALASITPASIFPKTRLFLSPIREQSCPSPIREQSHLSPPRIQSTLLPAPDQTRLVASCQRCQRMYVARVNRSSGRCHPRQHRASNH